MILSHNTMLSDGGNQSSHVSTPRVTYHPQTAKAHPTPAVIKHNTTSHSSSGGTKKKSTGSSGSSGSTGTGYTAPVTSTQTSSGDSGYSDSGSSYDDGYDAYMAQLQAAAQASYERNMARIQDSYNQAAANTKSNLDSTIGSMNSSFDKNKSSINSDAENSVQQAYINKMLSQRNLQQTLSAQGLNGGASETTQASMQNNYGNSRNAIDTQRNKSISDLSDTYQQNLAQAQQQYNSAMTSLEQQRMQQEEAAESALNSLQSSYMLNGNFSTDQSYRSQLASLASALQNFTYSPTAATNSALTASTTQAQNSGGTNYGKYLNSAAYKLAGGASRDSVKQELYQAASSGSISTDTLTSILNQLGITA